ncbi:MAG: DUF4434 domain-containing protein, partial [Acidimicrobiales bacterium]
MPRKGTEAALEGPAELKAAGGPADKEGVAGRGGWRRNGRRRRCWAGAASVFTVVIVGSWLPGTARSYAAEPAATPSACTAGPHLSSTFLPTYLAVGWDEATWASKLAALRADCITNVVIQYSADVTTQTAYFPTTLSGWTESSGSPVVADALAAADGAGVTVTVGLATNDRWFSQHADPVAMTAQAATDVAVADQLWARYRAHPSLAGWYLPLEVDSTNFTSTPAQQAMATYYAAVAGHLHALAPGLPVMVAPFFDAAGPGGQTPSQWQAMWAYLVAQAPLDIVAVQDGAGDSGAVDGSLGAAPVTPAQLTTWFAATAAGVARGNPGAAVWDDVDLYSPQDGRPMPTAQVVGDMAAAAPSVQAFTSFSWFSQLDPSWIGTTVYEDAYRSYATTGAVPAEVVGTPGPVAATASDSHTVVLRWGPATAPAGVAGYLVYRDTALVAVVRGAATSSLTDADASSGPATYAVAAFDAAGNRSPAVPVAVTVPPEPDHVDVATGLPYSATVAAQAPYQDPGTRLTAGVAAPASYTDPAWQGRATSEPYSLTVDLGSAQALNQVSIEGLADLAVGIYLPAAVTWTTSTDGTSFVPLAGPLSRPAAPVAPAVARYVATVPAGVTARWVRATVAPMAAYIDWTFVADLTVDRFVAATPTPPTPTPPTPTPPTPTPPTP